jgi:ubiquinone/menaquinone biosynthesis C-methylase UbiE
MPSRYAKTRDIAAKYDVTADEHYDLRYKDMQFQKYDVLLAHAERLLGTRDIVRIIGDTILDSGCGSGLLIWWLADCWFLGGTRYVGIDISLGMLSTAMTKARKGCGSKPGINLIQATAELPPLRDAVAASAFSVSTYQNLDDVQQASYVMATRRVLRKDSAMFLFSVLRKSINGEKIDAIEKELKRLFARVMLLPDDPRVEDRMFLCIDP